MSQGSRQGPPAAGSAREVQPDPSQRDAVLLSEIQSQPQVLAALVDRGEELRALAQRLWDPPPALVVVAARGTSDHAAVYAKYLVETVWGIPVSLAAPSVVTLYRRPWVLRQALVVAISQSGESPDILAVVEAAKEAGARTVAVVNAPSSPLAQMAHETVDIAAGPEASVAATKTFTAELVTLALLITGAAQRQEEDWRPAFGRLPEAVGQVLAPRRAERLESLGRTLAAFEHAYVVGRGLCFPAALEVALKLKEMAQVLAEGYSAADLRHGPLALAGPSLPVLMVGGDGSTERDLEALAGQARRLGSLTAALTDREALAKAADHAVPLPPVHEILDPVVAAVAGQRLAYAWARARGVHPGDPPGLSKVTRTW